MRDILQELDNIFKNLLQKDLQICLNNKVLKNGKFYLFQHGYFNFVLYIKTKVKNTSIKLPIPFDYTYTSDRIELSYKIKLFTNGIKKIDDIVEKIKPKNPSKFYDNVIVIKILN